MYRDYKNIEHVKPSGLDLKDQLVGVQRVAKVTKGGRTFGFSAIVVVGDQNGVVGQGLGKSKEVASAIAKGIDDAKKNLVRIPITEGTVPHSQKGKYSGARVLLMPASEGTGVIAGGPVRAVVELLGITDLLSKSQGSSNPHNIVKATFDALLKMRGADMVAKERGISLDKVFNG
ncbi:MAG TPA: 30S ribosomal protein S5 [Flavobacteriaceae bacterium]|nr:30S ribosomal protein S5 [Flavobacteriaceae bacterium]